MTPERQRSPSPLTLRLAAAFLAVAVLSVAVFGIIVAVVDRADVNNATGRREQADTAGVTSAALNAYASAGSWSTADLTAVAALAGDNRIGVRITAANGTVVVDHPVPGGRPGRTATRPLRLDGQRTGTVIVTEPSQPLSSTDRRLSAALQRSVLAAAGVAAVVALAAALAVSGRITRPLRRLTAAVVARGAGTGGIRVGGRPGTGELGQLAAAFDTMVADLDRYDELRRALVADVAHELRTPVAILQGEIEAILDGITPLTEGAVGSLHEEVVRLGRLVEDLQTFAAAQAAALNLQVETVDLAGVAASAAVAQRRSANDAGLRWQETLMPALVDGDPLRLHQILTNLLANAIKYTPAGGTVRLQVGIEGDDAVLHVGDTGPGIPADELPHVFERYRRGNHTDVAGTGIGLAVTAALVAAHHGTVEVTSPTGGGTRAIVRLPKAHG
ncbi:MAG: sensor histidine kinase [Acidimicrobiales bacterium]